MTVGFAFVPLGLTFFVESGTLLPSSHNVQSVSVCKLVSVLSVHQRALPDHTAVQYTYTAPPLPTHTARMDVTTENFEEALEAFRGAVADATLLSFDTELTGLDISAETCSDRNDTLLTRYQKVLCSLVHASTIRGWPRGCLCSSVHSQLALPVRRFCSLSVMPPHHTLNVSVGYREHQRVPHLPVWRVHPHLCTGQQSVCRSE
jgi:CAF1 family ribonuclease